MRRSPVLVPLLILLAGCGGSSEPSGPAYRVTLAQTGVRTGGGGEYLRDITLRVTTPDGDAASAVVGVQFTAGSVDPTTVVSDVNGDAELTWTIPAAQKLPGHTYSLGFCAHDSGGSCSVDLNGSEVVRVTF
jgi:hypothetical protein